MSTKIFGADSCFINDCKIHGKVQVKFEGTRTKPMIDGDSIGKIFRDKHGVLWRCITVTRGPTVVFDRLDGGLPQANRRRVGAVGSQFAEEHTELSEGEASLVLRVQQQMKMVKEE